MKNSRFVAKALEQLCLTRCPFKGFVRPSSGFCCSKNIVHPDNLSLFW